MSVAVLQPRSRPAAIHRIPRVQGKPVLRRSLVENLLACPTYANGESEDAAFGTYLHEAIALYHGTCLAHKEETRLADVDRIARDTFFLRPRGLHPGRLAEGKRLLDRFARNFPAEIRTLKRQEHKLATDIGWAILTGTIDAEHRIDDDDVDDPPRIVRLDDWKTGWGIKDHDWQIRFYTCLRFLEEGSDDLEEVQSRVVLIRRGLDPIEDYWTREHFERGELGEWWREEVLEPLAKLWRRRRQLGPQGGAACTYCAKRLTCAAAEPVSAARPSDDEEMEVYFADTLRQQALLDDRKKVQKAYFANRDPLVLRGYDVGPLMPVDNPDTLVILPGKDADVAAYMEEVQKGSSAFVKRDGINPSLIDRAWWDGLEEAGLAQVVTKRGWPKVTWRKHVEKGPKDTGTAGEEEPAQAAGQDSSVRVLRGGLDG